MSPLPNLIPLLIAFLTAGATAASPADDEQLLVVRYALQMGSREAGGTPVSGEVRSPEELALLLFDWEPGGDSSELKELFSLEEMGEVVRQLTVLPASGGETQSTILQDGTVFEIHLEVRPRDDDAVVCTVEIRRDGELMARPMVLTRLAERAIISAHGGPAANMFFLVIEVDRISRERINQRGLHLASRKDLLTTEDDGVTPPRALLKEPPKYTEEAREARIQGVVILGTVIDTSGRVTDIEVLKGLPLGLSEAAAEAVRQWRFEPALKDGKPVSVFYNLTINFRLSKDAPAAGKPGEGGPAPLSPPG